MVLNLVDKSKFCSTAFIRHTASFGGFLAEEHGSKIIIVPRASPKSRSIRWASTRYICDAKLNK